MGADRARDVSFLVLAVVTPCFRVPRLWSVTRRRGCSNTAQRMALMRRHLAASDASTIRLLLGTREFIGSEWLTFLDGNDNPFAIRAKAGLQVEAGDGRSLSLRSLLAKSCGARKFRATFPSQGNVAALTLTFAAKRLKGGELLIAASNAPAPAALAA